MSFIITTMKLFKNIKPDFTDERGNITKLLDDGKTIIKSTLLISSRTGSIRANHYHKKDSHYCYMLSGKMEYTEKKVGADDSKRETIIVEAGDMVYTPPMAIHAMRFLEDSVFIALATNFRHQEAYEEDTVKEDFIR